MSFWIKSLDENCKAGISKVLVGNKLDLEDTRQVDHAEGKALAEKYGMQFYETSAKSGINVEKVFLSAGEDIIRKNPNIAKENSTKTLTQSGQGKDTTKGNCC